MEEKIEKQWIVILGKAPRGPLTRAEVETLISRGMIKMNDLALPVIPGAPKSRAEWKFLWQYEEFDRRKQKDPGDITQESQRPERRAAVVPDQNAKAMAAEALPPELADLPVEQLIPKASRKMPFGEEGADLSDLPSLPPPGGVYSLFSRIFNKRFMGAGVGVTLALVLIVRFYGPTEMREKAKKLVPDPSRLINQQQPLFDVPSTQNTPNSRPAQPPPPVSAPSVEIRSAPGVIESAPAKPPEARTESPRDKEPSRDREPARDSVEERMDEDDEWGEEEEAPKKKKRTKGKRKPAAESEEGAEEEAAAEPESEEEANE